MDEIKISVGKKIFLRNAGKNEYWLQDLIYENPSVLGLGNLTVVSRERRQSTGGRLDILLKDEADDDAMYEVEVMLGETDPSHIIRTIEYWDNEKRRHPQRQHYAVLVAESFDRRFFNVLYILSQHVPIVAVQVNLLEVDGAQVISFTNVLNIYEEPTEDEDVKDVNPAEYEKRWNTAASWTVQAANALLNIVNTADQPFTLNFRQPYVALRHSTGANSYWFTRLSDPKSWLNFRGRDSEKVEAVKKLLDGAALDYRFRMKEFRIAVDAQSLSQHQSVFKEIHKLMGIGNDRQSE
jgi:hypothetical protein